MIRSCMLTILLMFVCVNSLSGMLPACPAPKQQNNSISEEIFRDVLHGGLIAPALLALGIQAWTINKEAVKSIELMNHSLIGYIGIAIPIMMRCLGHIFDVEKGNPTYSASFGRNVFRCGYGILVGHLMLNASDVINGITSFRAG